MNYITKEEYCDKYLRGYFGNKVVDVQGDIYIVEGGMAEIGIIAPLSKSGDLKVVLGTRTPLPPPIFIRQAGRMA